MLRVFVVFDTIHERDRQTPHDSADRAASHDKKYCTVILSTSKNNKIGLPQLKRPTIIIITITTVWFHKILFTVERRYKQTMP